MPVARAHFSALPGNRSRYKVRVPRARRTAQVRVVAVPNDNGGHEHRNQPDPAGARPPLRRACAASAGETQRRSAVSDRDRNDAVAPAVLGLVEPRVRELEELVVDDVVADPALTPALGS